jgi:hypothetical protein
VSPSGEIESMPEPIGSSSTPPGDDRDASLRPGNAGGRDCRKSAYQTPRSGANMTADVVVRWPIGQRGIDGSSWGP